MDRYNNNFIFLFAVYNKGTLDGSQWMDVRDYKQCPDSQWWGRGCTDLIRIIVLDMRSMDAGNSGPYF
jgi:hypothetical protein